MYKNVIANGFGKAVAPIDNPEQLYLSAVQLFVNCENENKSSKLRQNVVAYCGNNSTRTINYLVDLLSNREQWIEELNNSKLSTLIEKNANKVINFEAEELQNHLTNIDNQDIQEIVSTIIENKIAEEGGLNTILPLNNNNKVTSCTLSYFCNIIYSSSSNKIKTTYSIRDGLNKENKTEKIRIKEIASKLTPQKDTIQRVSLLPTHYLSKIQKRNYDNIGQALLLCEKNLSKIMKSDGVADFAQITIDTLALLKNKKECLEIHGDYQHILIDEFQDTSSCHHELVHHLVKNWENTSKTLFLVGDPKQSLYLFRSAALGLFLETKVKGVNKLSLDVLQLSVNFRSYKSIVDWVNRVFSTSLPLKENANLGAASYTHTTPFSDKELPNSINHIITNDSGDKEFDEAVEAEKIARTIKDNLLNVPHETNAVLIRSRAALKKLDKAFNHQVLVLDIDEVLQIRPQDIGNKTIVVVSTLANLRVKDTSGRKIYAYHENFEPHFAKVPSNHPALELLERVGEDDIQENGLSSKEIGNIKYSFANLLALYNPLVIVDEAHNARTTLTFETLRRIHPAAVLEFTATPNTSPTNGSNILYHVSASELKAEEMIKLPIILTEHQNWQDAVRDAVINRNKLADDAQKDTDYIRPIALFQAENKDQEVTVEVLRHHLINELKIDEGKIAVATGNQRELDGINLFEKNCKIEHIITNQALKEGWDCSFAYVFCSVKQVSSSRDAEQLLGRVLRMPYAKRRVIEDLNRAYAHLATSKFSQAAHELTDKLISMGFEEMEVAAFLKQQPSSGDQNDFFLDSEGQPITAKVKQQQAVVVELPSMPDLTSLSEDEKSQISLTQDGELTVVRIAGEVSDGIKHVLVSTTTKKADKAVIERDLRIHNQSIDAAKCPSERGEVFGSLPLLCISHQDELDLVEPQTFLDVGGWSLLDYPALLNNFKIEEKTNSFSIDVEDKKISYHLASEKEAVNFNDSFIDVTENDLIRWLDRELRQIDVIQSEMIKFLSILIKNLIQQPNTTLTALIRNKFPLSRAIRELIKLSRKKAQQSGYQQALFGGDIEVVLSDQFSYEFKPNAYPSRSPYYSGRYKFQKHYFPNSLIEDLKSTGEEYECAKAIDGLPEIKYWIRNLVRREQASFWLPLAHNKFYPDFICELNDGRMLVVEYKGEAYVTNDDSAEKRNVGKLWEDASEGKCLFIMTVEQDSQGRDVRQQILDKI